MNITHYKVGGCVRDGFLGVKSKDIDYAVEAPSYEAMRDWVVAQGGQIFLEKPEYLTIRASVNKEAADFVLCRKDGDYTDGRRPDQVIAGTIDDDLARRDFTMNAIAFKMNAGPKEDPFYDPHNGIADIDRRTIRCVGDAFDRLNEDPLRILRAIRFSITKGFDIHSDTRAAMIVLQDKVMATVSIERIREELTKCFQFDTLATIQALESYKPLRDAVFAKMWLSPTTKKV